MVHVNPLRKIRLDVSYESSATQRIHMKHQVLFSSKDRCKKCVVCCNFAWPLKVKLFVVVELSALKADDKINICKISKMFHPSYIIS